MALMRALVLVFSMFTLVACRGALAEGKSQFDLGSYPEARRTFAKAESDSRTWSDAERARYALYRGLTLGALGDQPRAGAWLRQAKAIDDARPGSLTAEEARRLHLGLESNAE